MQAKTARNARHLVNALALGAAVLAALVIAGGALAVAGTDAAIATPDIAFSSPNPVDGSQISVLVTVHNLGDQNATQVVVTAYVTSTNELIGSSTIGFLSAQSQLETAIQWNVSGEGPMTVTVTVQSLEPDVNPGNNNAISQEISVRARPDLKVNSVTFDNEAPPVGTVAVGITVTISNIGGSDASLVKVALYDGPPSDMKQIMNTTLLSGVTLASPVSFNYFWDLTNQGGRHDIYAVVENSVPGEKADASANNVASGRLLVLTPRDFEVTTSLPPITFDPLFDGFVIIRSGGHLTLSNSTFTLLQERDNQFDFIVESGGTLSLWNARIASSFSFGITLHAGATVEMRAGSMLGGSVASTGGALWLFNTTVEGGLTGMFSPLWVEDSTVHGAIIADASAVTLRRSTVVSPTNMALTGSTLSVEWLTLISVSDPSLSLTAGSTANLAGIDSGVIFVETGSSASIWRLAEFEVSDLTGIPIPRATVDSRFALQSAVVSSVMTDEMGKAQAWLLTDVLDGGSPQYVGSYLHTATFLTSHTTAVVNMQFYPTLTAESDRESVALVFDVIDPADLFSPTAGDKTVTTLWDINDYNQTGNLAVRGILNVNGILTVWQNRDFETAVTVHSGKIAIGPNGGIRSNHLLNVYLFNSSEFTAEGGTVDVNSVVTFGSSRVSIANGTNVPRGSFILMGSSFTMGSGVTVSGTQLYARQGTSVVFEGVQATFAVVDLQTAGDISLRSTQITTFTGFTLMANGKTLTAADSTLLCGSPGSAAFAAHFINFTSTVVSGCDITMFSADTVQARDTVFTSTLKGFKPGSTAAFYDVSYPALVVDPSAIVTTAHRLTITAIDINQNAVVDGTWSVEAVPSGTSAGGGSLVARVDKDLQASTIAQGYEVFTGNYRVTVTAAQGGFDPIVRDVVMDGPRAEVFFFPEEIVAPSSMQIVGSVAPEAVVNGSQISVTGTVVLMYPNRAAPFTPHPGLEVHIADAPVDPLFNQVVTTDATGAFNFTGPYTASDSTPGARQLRLTATYNGASGQYLVTLTLLPPPPAFLQLLVDSDALHFDLAVGQSFKIHGTVQYLDAGGAAVGPANNSLVQVSFYNPPQPDPPPSVRADANGRFEITVFGRQTPKSYTLNVVARDDATGLASSQQLITALVGQGPVNTNPGGGITLYILLGAVAAVGAVVAVMFINAKRKSVNYVECGNCGRPAHEGDKKCPSCGVEFEEDIAKCSHCASWIPANAIRCPKCNTEFKPVGDAIEAPVVAPDTAAPEGVKAEVTTPTPVKAPVAVKKKVLKTAEPASGQPPQADGPKFENPWDQPGDKPTQPIQPGEDQPKIAPKKPDEKKEKGLFDDL
jgi:hypothetical protein